MLMFWSTNRRDKSRKDRNYAPRLANSWLRRALLKGHYNAMVAVVGPSSVVRPMVISRKLRKIDPWLLWNTIRILLAHSDALVHGRYSGFKIQNKCSY